MDNIYEVRIYPWGDDDDVSIWQTEMDCPICGIKKAFNHCGDLRDNIGEHVWCPICDAMFKIVSCDNANHIANVIFYPK